MSLESKNVCDIMTPDPIHIRHTESILAAAKLMKEHEIGLLPIFENEKLVGVITDRDIVLRCVAAGCATSDPVSTAMSPKIISIRETDNLGTAVDVMEKNSVRRVLIIDVHGKLAGVISKNEILDYMKARL